MSAFARPEWGSESGEFSIWSMAGAGELGVGVGLSAAGTLTWGWLEQATRARATIASAARRENISRLNLRGRGGQHHVGHPPAVPGRDRAPRPVHLAQAVPLPRLGPLRPGVHNPRATAPRQV